MSSHKKIMTQDGFKMVMKKGRKCGTRRRKTKKKKLITQKSKISVKVDSFSKGMFLKGIFSKKKELKSKLMLNYFLKIINTNEYESFVCYGIGNVFKSNEAQYQFSLVSILLDKFFSKERGKFLYDPIIPLGSTNEVFEDFRTVLEKNFGMKWIEKNENCERKVEEKCLFFIPHGSFGMYKNLIRTNSDQLERIFILGNDFKGYKEDDVEFRKMMNNSHFQIKIAFNKELMYKYGLNDLFFHYFNVK